jgi:PAS domain S-box-containing protein
MDMAKLDEAQEEEGEPANRQGGSPARGPRWQERVLAATGNGVVVTDPNLPDNPIVYCNAAFERITGYPCTEAQGRNCRFLQGTDTNQDAVTEIRGCLEERRECRVTLLNYRRDGTPFWNELTVSPVTDDAGHLLYFVGLQNDVTERIRAEAERRQALEALSASAEALWEEKEVVEAVSRVGRMLSAELDQQRLVQAVTDAATALTGAQFGAFFYNVVSEAGDSYTLYTLSGVPREAFSAVPMPRATDLFGPTFRGEGVVRSDDITRDPRYGRMAPHHGMPEGHLPVRSYLAVPVTSRSGEVLGGLFFGHADAGVFTEREERLTLGLAAQAAVALDNARLFERAQREIAQRRKAEEALRENERRTRGFLRDVLLGVSEGRLRLCDAADELPPPLAACGPPLTVTRESLREIRHQTVDVAESQGLSLERWQDLVTAVGEAATNAVVHGGGGLSKVCSGKAGQGESGGTVQVWISDQGQGIAFERLHRATLERGYTTAGTLGHGFWMMLRTVDRIWLLTGPTGTTVVLEQDHDPPLPAWLREAKAGAVGETVVR